MKSCYTAELDKAKFLDIRGNKRSQLQNGLQWNKTGNIGTKVTLRGVCAKTVAVANNIVNVCL